MPVWVIKGTYRHNMVIIRRIDVVIALGFIFTVGWYYVTTGWQGAIIGGMMYLVTAAVALWLL